jgi:hypothetical protein
MAKFSVVYAEHAQHALAKTAEFSPRQCLYEYRDEHDYGRG